MIDQRVTEGIKIDFFGDLASTTIPAQIIKKYECDIVPIYIGEEKILLQDVCSQPIKISSDNHMKKFHYI